VLMCYSIPVEEAVVVDHCSLHAAVLIGWQVRMFDGGGRGSVIGACDSAATGGC
jgi:hypothetical protein